MNWKIYCLFTAAILLTNKVFFRNYRAKDRVRSYGASADAFVRHPLYRFPYRRFAMASTEGAVSERATEGLCVGAVSERATEGLCVAVERCFIIVL